MITKIRGWIAAHRRWSVAVIFAVATPIIAYNALIWKTSLRPDRRASVDRLVEQFDQVVFHSEPGKEPPEWVAKWTNQIRIKIIGDDAHRWKEVIERQVVTMRQLTGLDIVTGSVPGKRENFFIYFADPSMNEGIIIEHIKFPGSQLESPEDLFCASYFMMPYRIINHSFIIVSTELNERLIALCIVAQLVYALGFSNTSELIRPSIFSWWEYDLRSPSINDRIIVRTLYDKRMRVGLNREQALYRARLIITELVAEAKAKEAAAGD